MMMVTQNHETFNLGSSQVIKQFQSAKYNVPLFLWLVENNRRLNFGYVLYRIYEIILLSSSSMTPYPQQPSTILSFQFYSVLNPLIHINFDSLLLFFPSGFYCITLLTNSPPFTHEIKSQLASPCPQQAASPIVITLITLQLV